tara:strand:+ start:375 stop:968 length:594 start_codon:yes stop_codon:yes gene_type:complete
MSISEESKGLWANIRAKRARGEKPARKGSEAYNKAKAAAEKINAQNEEVMDNKTPSSDMNYRAVNKAMSQSSMYEDEPSVTITTGSTKAMPMGMYEVTICRGCAIALLEDIKAGKFPITEAEYQGRKVPLGKPMRGDVKKFKVYVKKGDRVVKVNFGDPNMKIKKSNPERRKSFRARHRCATPGPRHKARYWSCRKW